MLHAFVAPYRRVCTLLLAALLFGTVTQASADLPYDRTVTITKVTTTPNPATAGQTVTISAAVTAKVAPAGSVSFTDGSTSLGTVSAGSAVPFTGTSIGATYTLRVSNLSVGTHSIRASYLGDMRNLPSTSAVVSEVVNAYVVPPVQSSTTTVLTTSPNPTAPGSAVALTATLRSKATPTGAMTFKDGASILGTVSTNNGGVFALSISSLSTGTHIVTAAYAGDTNNAPSTSNAVEQEVAVLPTVSSWRYGYDKMGRLNTMVDPNGLTTHIYYDKLGRPIQVQQSSNNGTTEPTITSITYDSNDRITSITDPRNLTTTYTNNGLGYVTAINSPDTGISRFTYDGLGNVLSSTDSRGKTTRYTYGNNGRVTAITVTPVNSSGTALGETNTPLLSNLSYNIDGAPNAWLWSDGKARTISHDNQGLAIRYELGDPTTSGVTRTLTRDVGGRIRGYTHSNSAGAQPALDQTFAYDRLNRLISAIAGNTTTLYDEAGQLLGEYDSNGAPLYETIHLGSTPVGVIKQTGSAATNDIAVTLYNVYADHIDTPRVITKQDQTIVWRWDTAEAFGATAPNQNPGGWGVFMFNQRFPGQVFDAKTGLFQNWNREYCARCGRYIQSDPIGLNAGVNTFGYGRGNPTRFIDPLGLLTLPRDPSGLPPDWVADPSHRAPNGERYRHPSGDTLDWNPGRPGEPGFQGKDHWHHNGGKYHHLPGDEVPDPQCPEEPSFFERLRSSMYPGPKYDPRTEQWLPMPPRHSLIPGLLIAPGLLSIPGH